METHIVMDLGIYVIFSYKCLLRRPHSKNNKVHLMIIFLFLSITPQYKELEFSGEMSVSRLCGRAATTCT